MLPTQYVVRYVSNICCRAMHSYSRADEAKPAGFGARAHQGFEEGEVHEVPSLVEFPSCAYMVFCLP